MGQTLHQDATLGCSTPTGDDRPLPVKLTSVDGAYEAPDAVALPVRGSLTERGGSVAAGGVSQQMMAANATRSYLLIQNNSAGDLWIRFGASAAAAMQPSFKLAAGDDFVMEGGFVTTQAVQVFGATLGQTYTAVEG